MNYYFNENKFNELEKSRKNNLFTYQIKKYMLLNLNLLTKKDGSDFANITKCFDIENLKTLLSKKYNVSYLYLTVSDYNFEINYGIDNLQGVLYIRRRVYFDEIKSQEEKQKKEYKKHGGGWLREYYNNNTTEEIRDEILSLIEQMDIYIKREQQTIKQLPTLKRETQKYIKSLNENLINDFDTIYNKSFWASEIKELIS